MAKKGPKMAVFCPGGPKSDPFSTNFCKSLLIMPKNIIFKNKKNPLSKKVSKSKKLQKWPKKGQKWPFFGPPGPNFSKIKKRLGHSLTFTPERLYTKFQKIWLIRLGENALRTNRQTDGRDWNHRSLRKNSGDQLEMKWSWSQKKPKPNNQISDFCCNSKYTLN